MAGGGINLILTAILCLNSTINNCINNSTTKEIIQQLTTNLDTNLTNSAKPNYNINTHFSPINKKHEIREWLNGRHLTIATLEDYPLSYTRKEHGQDIAKGVSFSLVNFLAKKFNFTYDVIKPERNVIGTTVDFKDSLLDLLNKSDLAAAFIPILAEVRSHAVYSATTLDEGEWIMVMQRPAESASGSGLLAPFDYWVWITILVSLLLVGPIIYCLIIIRNKLTGDNTQTPYSLGHCAWFVYGALMKQGSTLSPVADSTRLLFATWWIFITILTSFYTANLTAFLTLSRFTLPFNAKEDILAKQKHFVAGAGSGIEYAIKTPDDVLFELYPMIEKNRAIFSDLKDDKDILADYVEKKGYVFIRDRPAMDHLLYNDYSIRRRRQKDDEKLHCPFAVSKRPFMSKKRAFAYPLNSNLSYLLDPELLNLVESGIVKHLSRENLPKAEICPTNLGSTERQLRNGDLMMTYYIMAAGFGTSVIVFLTEMLFRFLNGHRERQNNEEFLRKVIKPKTHRRNWGEYGSGMKQLSAVNMKNNITPPPPYTSIFNQSRNILTNMSKIHEIDTENQGIKRFINGRDYMVYRNENGVSQLIPVRAPSATLFQYTYTK